MPYLSLNGFTTVQQLLLLGGFLLFVASFILHFQGKTRWAIGLLTLGGLCFFIFAAIVDPFLHSWDERFHAVVAKNCMDDPFAPKLYKEWVVEQYNPALWSHGYIWLHKQPLFLWQIALCFKLFGVSTFTLRLPSVLMATVMIPMVYRIGSILIDRRLGYYAAVSVAFSWFLIDLVSGNGTVDHNNVCFVFYVTASLWAWLEYVHSGRKWGWMVLTALFSGCAVMTKWLTGLLVYLVWGCYLLSEYRFKLKDWKIGHFVVAVAITAALFLPWQIYTAKTFPDLYAWERGLQSLHFTTDLEGHGETADFYLRTLPFLYIGDSKYWSGVSSANAAWNAKRIFHLCLILGGLFLLIWRMKKWSHRIVLITTVLFVYVFFSLAATKMPAYPFCIAAIGYLSLAMILYECQGLAERFLHQSWVRGVVLGTVSAIFALYQMNFAWLRNNHTDARDIRQVFIHNTQEMKSLNAIVPEKTWIFNVRGTEDWQVQCTSIEAMFFTDALCYPFPPTEEDLRRAKELGYHVAVLTSNEVPEYVLDSPEVQLIDMELYADY